MTIPEPVTIPRREDGAAYGGHRLERILGYAPTSHQRIAALVDDLNACSPNDGSIDHVAAYVDASLQTPVHISEGITAIHVLWTASGQRAEVFAGHNPDSGTGLSGHEVQPGDTLTVPQRVHWAIGAGIVAFVFGTAPSQTTTDSEARSPCSLLHPPGHGLNLFDRFNRRTICAAHEGLLLERWKISHTLELPLNPARWHYVTNLVEPVALGWPGGMVMLQRTESRFLPMGLDRITIVPDGLGYVLIGSDPDLESDAVRPLRRAGYDRAAIASLGVPSDLLEP
ncbi:MAG: hypothetical protein H0T93_10220 [Chloroflexia bacterium]|nr:hypothetical protein [Chloroflexia bacterium]